jgi:hypothetical protein
MHLRALNPDRIEGSGMEHAFALGSVIPAAIGAGCCAATRRPSWIVIIAMGLMVVAMSDTMLLGERLLPTLGWTVVLAGATATLVLTHRRHPLGAERAAHVGLAALLTAAMGLAHGVSTAGGAVSHDHLHHHGQGAEPAGLAASFPALVALPVLVCVFWSGILLVRAWPSVNTERADAGILCAEKVLGALSLLAMSAMVLVM